MLAIIAASCGPFGNNKKNCDGGSSLSFMFHLSYRVTPCKDTFKLGDTLWIESVFSNQMFNENNNKTYKLPGDFDFKLFGSFGDLATNPEIGLNDFILLDKDGNIDTKNRNGIFINIKPVMANDTFRWKCGIILKKTGAFMYGSLSDLNGDPLAESGQHITKCGNEWLRIIWKRGNCATHEYFVLDAADPNIVAQYNYIKELDNQFIFFVKN